MNSWPESVAVVGAAGVVGSGIVYELVTSGLAEHVIAVDTKEDLLTAHTIDIRESALVYGPTHTKLVTGSMDELTDIDVVVLAASSPERPQEGRRASLTRNVRLLEQLASSVTRAIGESGAVLVVSNPVDILADSLRRLTRLRDEQIVGYSLNDSTRFRVAVGHELRIEPHRIDATVLGEHGSGQVPLFSRIRADGESVTLKDTARERVAEELAEWFPRWVRLNPGRSSGWATARGVIATLRRMAVGELLPSSVATGGAYGLPDTFITLPSVLSTSGVTVIEEWGLSMYEQELLTSAARSVRGAADEMFGRH